MKVSTLGIDLAKNTFQLHAASRRGEKISSKKVKREKLLQWSKNSTRKMIS